MRRSIIAFSVVVALAFTGCSSDSSSDATTTTVEDTTAYCDLVRQFEDLLTGDLPDDQKVAQGLQVYGEATGIIPSELASANRTMNDPTSDTEDKEVAEQEIDDFNDSECGVDTAALAPIIADLTTGTSSAPSSTAAED